MLLKTTDCSVAALVCSDGGLLRCIVVCCTGLPYLNLRAVLLAVRLAQTQLSKNLMVLLRIASNPTSAVLRRPRRGFELKVASQPRVDAGQLLPSCGLGARVWDGAAPAPFAIGRSARGAADRRGERRAGTGSRIGCVGSCGRVLQRCGISVTASRGKSSPEAVELWERRRGAK